MKQDYSALFKLGLPVLVTQLGIIVVSFADTMMVGHYGTPELAASAFVNSVFTVPTVMQIGFAAGITPLVGALYGRSDLRATGGVLRAGLVANISLSVALTIIMGALYFLLPYMGQPEELLPVIRPYFLIVMASLLPMAIFNCCQQTANGCTDTATPMWIMLGGNLMNIIGNYMLIYGKWGAPELGLAGAGISTLAARTAMCLAILAVIFTRRRYTQTREGFHLPLRGTGRIREVVHTSYPIMIQSGVECAMWSFGAVVCGRFGTVQLAAYQVVNIIGQLGFMIYMSFSTATSIRVANFMGTSNFRGVVSTTRAGLNMLLVLATFSSIIFIFLARPLMYSFTEDEAVVASALTLLVPLVLYQYADAAQFLFANALRGMTVVKPLLWVSVIAYIVIGSPSLWLMGVTLDLGNVGIYYSFSIALVAAAALYYYFYRASIRKLLN